MSSNIRQHHDYITEEVFEAPRRAATESPAQETPSPTPMRVHEPRAPSLVATESPAQETPSPTPIRVHEPRAPSLVATEHSVSETPWPRPIGRAHEPRAPILEGIGSPALEAPSATPIRVHEPREQQIFTEFHNYLYAELFSRDRRARLENLIRSHLPYDEGSITSDAVQAVAATFAKRIDNDFGSELAAELNKARRASWRAQLSSRPLHTQDDYTEFLSPFVSQFLPSFYPPDSPAVQEIATRAAETISHSPDIPPDLVPGLAKLALYDFAILCDNSGSMNDEDRIPALRSTLSKVAEIATTLSDAGISIRLLNTDAAWDGVTDVRQIDIDQIDYAGDTQLGTKLWHKVLRPLIVDKIVAGTFRKPVIVVIITDGEPTNEHRDALRHSIHHCDERLQDKAAVAYLVSRVGTSAEATAFLEELRGDPYLGHSIYTGAEDLALTREVFERAKGDREYFTSLVRLFLEALHVRTKL